MKDDEGNKEREGTFKYFQGKFSSLYEKMGQKLKGFLALKNEFVVEDNETEDESLTSSVFPDFDPSKFDSESNVILETTERRVFKVASTKSDPDEVSSKNMQASYAMVVNDSKSRQVSINESKKIKYQKTKRDIRNRSSEFSKNDLKMIDPSIIHRNSNDLYRYKNKTGHKEHRRMYGSGFALSNIGEKFKDTDSANGSLKESMTRKKITAFKVTSKNSNHEQM
jgi:hypothetical protein